MIVQERMNSFVDRGNALINKGKTAKAMKLIARGLQHYSGKILNAIQPYAKSDAGMIVIVLRHIADEIEKNNPGAKGFAEEMSKCIEFPELKEIERVRKANRK